MPTTVQFRRGTTGQNNSFTGAAGELTIDTDKDTIRVHDGSTAGGFELSQNAATQTLTNKTINSSGNTITISGAEATLSNIANSSLSNSSITFAGDSGSDSASLGETVTIAGGTGLTSTGTSNTITIGIDNGGVDTTQLAADAVDGTKIADDSIDSEHIVDGSVDNVHLAGSIANAKLANSSITVTDGSTSTATSLGGTITFSGTSNEVEVGESSGTITVGLPDNVVVGNNLTVTGNLTVSGTTTTVDTTNTVVSDTLLELGNGTTGTPGNDAGIVIERGDSNNAFMGFDESADKFIVGTGSFTGSSTGNLTITTGTLVANLEGDVTGDVTGNADTATALSSAVTVELTGDVTGSATFTSAGDTASISTTVAANSVALGTDTTGNYVATVTGGTGIASSGATSGEGIAHTLSVDLSELTDMTATMVGSDEFIVLDAGADRRKAASEIGLSIFNNDANFSTTTGTVTSVSGGNGLTGSVTSSGSLAVGAGTLIDVTADAVNVDLSELTTSTSDGDGDFFVVVDAANAQKKLTKANINISGFNNDSGFTTNVGDITDVTAGTGLSGGGSSGSVTLNVDLSELTDMTATMTGTDEFIVLDASADRRKAANEIGLSIFNNDAGFTTNTGDITGVTAGNGLTGGGSSGGVTLNVGAGTGISVSADEVALATAGAGAGTYGSTSDGTKIDQITLDAYGRVTAVSTGSTGTMTSFQLEDGDGTEVTISHGKEVKFVEGTGIEINWTDTSTGSDADPYDLTFTVDVSDFMSNGSNNRVVTATGTDGMNAEANMTFDGSTLDVTGAIRATGDITAFYSSDETLKTNIETIENPMDKVKEIKGVSYNWTPEAQEKHAHFTEHKEIGVIAQDVEKALPEIVATRSDGTKAVRYERMCALLIECVKDLQNQIDELKK